MTRSQLPPNDPPVFNGGYQVLAAIAKNLGVQVGVQQIVHRMGGGRRNPTTQDLMQAARRLGLRARLVTDPSPQKLARLPIPAMIKLDDGWYTYKGESTGGVFRIVDPIEKSNSPITLDELYARFRGEVILLGKGRAQMGEELRFGISWYMPLIKRYRWPIIEMLVLSFFLNLLALGYPLSLQLVIDKVLPHKSYSTLVVVIAALLLLAVFNALLKYLRQYLLQHTANRIDVELSAKLYSHLLHLPISFFETRAAGVIVTRVRELRSIRNFVTGQALLSCVDLLFIFVYLAVLFIYSWKLSFIVLGSLPFYVIISLFMRPALRRLLKAKFRTWAAGQKLLVESIVGIQTVKSSAIEPLFERKWEERVAAYARTSFDAKMLGVKVSTATSFLSKVTSALVLFFGVLAVMSGTLSVGGLIAFKLISRLVTKPILRTTQLYQSFQEVQVSIDHVADIFNSEVERFDQGPMPQIRGDIEFRNVTFRYRPELPPAVNNVSLSIEAGEVIGIVGPSGSGKSTLTKLLQRFHTPNVGEIYVDGFDIAQVDPARLRSQLGVVLQENFLFNQSIHENIAMARPELNRNQVIRVARLAGADEFISKLPHGYDTKIEERGANLSGGQRQRLAIARALATNPRILIFDEATSALDYESEQIIQDNMTRIVQDRTVIIIAHRLAAVRYCDRIVGMVDGEVVETGTHEQLLKRRGSLYGHLWSLQNDHVTS